MAVKTIAELKTLWINGFIPDQNDYVDLFDTIEDLSSSTSSSSPTLVNTINDLPDASTVLVGTEFIVVNGNAFNTHLRGKYIAIGADIGNNATYYYNTNVRFIQGENSPFASNELSEFNGSNDSQQLILYKQTNPSTGTVTLYMNDPFNDEYVALN